MCRLPGGPAREFHGTEAQVRAAAEYGHTNVGTNPPDQPFLARPLRGRAFFFPIRADGNPECRPNPPGSWEDPCGIAGENLFLRSVAEWQRTHAVELLADSGDPRARPIGSEQDLVLDLLDPREPL